MMKDEGRRTKDERWRTEDEGQASASTPPLARPVSLSPCLLVSLILLIILASCGSARAQPATIVHGTLQLDAPATAQVGQPINVSVRLAAAPDGLALTLTAMGSYGPRVYRTNFTNGVAQIIIPANDTRQSGLVTLTAQASEAHGEGQVELLPGAPVAPITPLVGARAIPADGTHWSMTVAVPFDMFGNPVAEGTPVQIRALHPGEKQETQTIAVRNLVAWAHIYSRTRAGRTIITTSVGDAHGPETELEETAGWPANITLAAEPPTLPADGWQLVTLRTATLRDRFGNVLPDGTLVLFVADMPDGTVRRVPAETIDGIAEAPLQASTTSGTAFIRATVYQATSAPLSVVFTPGPAVGSFPLTATIDAEAGEIQLDAGPLLGPLGQFVPDGSTATFTLTDAHGQSQHLGAEADRGHARGTFRLSALQAGTYTIDAVAGAGRGRTQVTIP